MNLPQKDLYDYLTEENRPVIIYGMGNGADKIMDELHRRSIPVSGVTASDSFIRGQSFRGFPVKPLSQLQQELNDPIIIVAFGTCLPEVMEHIFHLAQQYTVLAADVPVYGNNIWCREFLEDNREAIDRAFALLADEASRQVYEKVLSYKLTGRLSFLQAAYSPKEQVFEELLTLNTQESYLDLGAYRGDTIDEFLRYSGGSYRHITALEPDRKTFAKLKAHTAGMKNLQLFRMGIWSEDMELPFRSAQGRGSGIDNDSEERLAVTKIDTLYAVRPVTYIKMDVEGSEQQALFGGVKTLKRDRPKLNMAVYHRSEDIFSLPLLLHSICPEYRIYLRQHPYIPAWDLNLYAIKQ